MSKKKIDTTGITNELEGASVFFTREKGSSAAVPKPSPAADQLEPQQEPAALVEATQEVSKEGSKEVRKYTSKLVSTSTDPAVNKVGYYFTRREMDQLDTLLMRLKPILRDRYNLKVSKNDIIRACLAIGIEDWEENQLTSKLVHLLTSK